MTPRTRAARVPAAGQLSALAMPPMKEEGKGGLRDNVTKLARSLGYDLVFHAYQSFNAAERGWPDLFMVRVRDHRLVIAELKGKGKDPTERQVEVLDILRALSWPRCTCNGPLGGSTFGAQEADGKLHDSGCARIGGAFSGMATRISVHVWRPADWHDGTIEGILR